MSNTRPLIGLCDRCRTPVRNYGTVAISPTTGLDLVLCGHHTNFHRPRLLELNWLILEPTLVELDAPTGPFQWMPPPKQDCDTNEDETLT